MRTLLVLLLAAVLEVGGDALLRAGLKGKGALLLAAGAAALILYGVLVNLTALDFGRLMGVYIVLFFVISQLTAVLLFHERPPLPVLLGGLLVICGGIIMSF